MFLTIGNGYLIQLKAIMLAEFIGC